MTALQHYYKGETTYFACRDDQRFGYCLYVPEAFTRDTGDEFALAVVIHGSTRTAQIYRRLFRDFAEANNVVVLAPLFPAGIIERGDLTNYKFIKFHDIRFDRLLLGMVDEVEEIYGIDVRRFLIHGFSGGGQFVHRFYYLHPERLSGVSIGAPGMVTLLDPERDWHCGIRGMDEVFGRLPDIAAMREVPVQMVIGAQDKEVWEITIKPDHKMWMKGVNDAGRDRLERLTALRRSFECAGIEVRFDLVEDIGHDGYAILAPVEAFFADVLRRERRAALSSADRS